MDEKTCKWCGEKIVGDNECDRCWGIRTGIEAKGTLVTLRILNAVLEKKG